MLLLSLIHISHLEIPLRTVVKGDATSASIAAASILAKVSRDRLMEKIDRMFPEYQFAKHKGYGTALHREMLLKYGPCPVHRRSFLKKILGDGLSLIHISRELLVLSHLPSSRNAVLLCERMQNQYPLPVYRCSYFLNSLRYAGNCPGRCYCCCFA